MVTDLNLLPTFKRYCEKRDWVIDRFTSEFTLQFRLCRFIENIVIDCNVELESNINRYEINNLSKKEIDIEISDSSRYKTAIELKYIRDRGSYNIGMFSYYEDIKFLEELVIIDPFKKGYCILFTSIPEIYTPSRRELNPRNRENLALYKSFREDGILKGTVSIKTGKLNKTLTISGTYRLDWFDFTQDIKACLVTVERS